MADRAASEVLGFILVFSLIAVSVGSVYVVGFAGLQDARNAEQLDNTERAFDVLADNLEDIVRNDAPTRATEFRLYEANFLVGTQVTFTVTITNVASPNTYTVRPSPLVYEGQGSPTTIRYLNGAVIRQDRGGAVFLNEPTFIFRKSGAERTAVVPLVETRPSGGQAVGGTGTVLVRAERALAETLTARTTPSSASTDPDGDTNDEYDVTLRVETTDSRAQLWRDYLNDELETAYSSHFSPGNSVNDACSLANPTTVECVFPVERLYVTVTRIDVSIEN